VLAWNAYSLTQTGVLSNRLVAWHPAPFKVWFEAQNNLITWADPKDLLSQFPLAGRMLSLLSLLLLPGLLFWMVWVLWQQYRISDVPRIINRQMALAFALALSVPVYLAFLVLSRTLFDAATPLNDRILSVIYLPEIILFACGLAWIWKAITQRHEVFRWLVGLLCALFLIFSEDGLSSAAVTPRSGLRHQGWQESQTIQAIRNFPTLDLYTNKPSAIYLLTETCLYPKFNRCATVALFHNANVGNDQQKKRRCAAGIVWSEREPGP
jgi:hypothetical protein